MKAVKVQYRVQPEYVEENKKNIAKVMAALRSNPIDGMMYSTYQDAEDPTKFIHVNFAKDEETMAKLNELEEFGAFRSALKESGPVSPPAQTKMDLVDAGFEMEW